MNKRIRRRITSICLALAMVCSLMPVGSKTAYADEAAAISLVTSATYTFDEATVGYGTQAPYQVQVRSEGTVATGELSITLGGSAPEAFVLSASSISSLAAGANSNFNVTPALGLSAGTYTAAVTVSGSSITASQSFNVSFQVNPAGTTYTAQIRNYVDGSLADASGNVELRSGSTSISMIGVSTGIYEATVGNGDYTVYVNGSMTGKHLTVGSTNSSLTLEYFTVSYTVTVAGAASGSSIGATVDGASISSGTRVMSGKTISITAAGSGAGSYTYAWSGTGISTQPTATISFTLSSTVNATCVVTGSGTPLTDPDYEINGEGYHWTGSVQTVALTGTDDTLVLHKAPAAAVTIEVQTADGSKATIKGNSIVCTNMKIVVSNDITLSLEDVNITSQTNWSALQLNADGIDGGGMTVIITGVCYLQGTGTGSGIRSEHGQNLVMKGNGTLNTIGAGNVSSSDGGSGIYVIAYNDEVASLTIEGDITVNAEGGSSLTHSGGSGIDVAGGNLTIKGGIVNARSGSTSGTNYNASYGIMASFQNSNHSLGGNITILGGTVNAIGGDAGSVAGGYGIYTFSKLTIQAGSVTATGGNSTSGSGGAAVIAYEQNIEVSGGSLRATGGNSTSNSGGQAIYNFYKDILISGGTVTATGGQSVSKNGGIAMMTAGNGTGSVLITGGTVNAAGGGGGINGAHAVYSDKGTVTVSNGANLKATGGTGGTGVGGVGVRAPGVDGSTLKGNTVTIANSAGTVYIRGGQGATARRASIMGKDVYISTGNIGAVVMEGSNSRSVKNASGGENVYMVTVALDPAAVVEISCTVASSGGEYTYRAVTDADGTACLWLPEGAQILEPTDYTSAAWTVVSNDTSNTVSITKSSVVTAHDSDELNTYMAATYVTTINLVSSTTYTYNGTTVTRALTINGNGAIINVGTGFTDTIVKRVGNTVTGKVFLAVQNAGLTLKEVTLRDISTRILAVINVKAGGTLTLDGVTFEGFYANLGSDTYPDSANIPGSYNNFGVHAEPDSVSTTVKNCIFGASNTFRNAVAIRNGIAVIEDNTFIGTATPERQNQTDGFEYGVYLYGGSCTVSGNDFSGYDSILKELGYHSAGITTCPYYSLTATITGNTFHDNARGIDGVGAWHTYTYPASVQMNGIVLDSSENAFIIGQILKSTNTFSNNTDGNIALTLDQNDNYIDTITGLEYGPSAYYDTFLTTVSTGNSSAMLSFDSHTWAKSLVRNSKTIIMQVSEDNGTTWRTAEITGTLNTSSTGVTVNLSQGKSYLLRSVLTITAKTMPYGSATDVYTDADIVCYSNTVRVTINSTGSPASATATTDSKSVRQVDVNGVGNSSSDTVATVDIVRESSNGKKTDSVVLNQTKTEEVIQKVVAQKQDKVQIVVDDLPENPADELKVTVSKSSIQKLSDNQLDLEILTDEVTIHLPAESVAMLTDSDEDLYFRVVPIRDKEQKEETKQEAMTASIVLQAADGSKVEVLGTPMSIETNYKSTPTKVVFSLKAITIPTDQTEREAFLASLGVYVNHSDGEKELNRGTIIYDKDGNPVGIEIEISKFSTFTIVSIENTAPEVSKIKISGKTKEGSTLTAAYAYSDRDQDEEGATLIEWYRADSKSGKNKKLIASGATYQITAKDKGKYLLVMVTPIAKSGVREGSKVTAFIKMAAVNTAPQALSVKITGGMTVGSRLTASYTYKDAEKNTQGSSIFQWYRSDSKDSTGKTAIPGADDMTYTLTEADQGKYISFTVTPVAITGTRNGAAVTVTTKSAVKEETVIYKSFIKLGLIGRKSYAEKVAEIFKKEHEAGNVRIALEGKYYRVYLDFADKAAAQAACEDMKKRNYIVNYYYCKK